MKKLNITIKFNGNFLGFHLTFPRIFIYLVLLWSDYGSSLGRN